MKLSSAIPRLTRQWQFQRYFHSALCSFCSEGYYAFSFFLFSTGAALTCALLFSANVASADVTFDLNNVDLVTGTTASGTLTGSFVTNDAFTTLVSADIAASPSGTYTGETYTLANSTDNSVVPNFLQLNLNPVTSTSPELRLVFSSALSPSGASLTSSSFEFEITGGERFVSSGTVTEAPVSGTPEPTSAALIGGPMALLILLGLRRKQRRISA